MLSTRQVEFMMQTLEETLAEYSFIPAYEFHVDNYPGDGWCIESEHYDDGMNATVTIKEMSRVSDEDMKSVAIEQLISNIVDRHQPKKVVPLSDRKDLYVIRTLMYMGDDQEYGYWMSSKDDSLAIGLYKENNSAHIFEEKDKVLAERICELLNKSQHEYSYEVVSFYDAWRCL